MDNSEFNATLIKLAELWKSTGVFTNGISVGLLFEDWLNAIASCLDAIEMESPSIAVGNGRRLSDRQNKAIAFLGTCSAQQQAQMMCGPYFRIETNE